MTAKLTPYLRLRNAQDFIENLVGHPVVPFSDVESSHKVDRNHYIFIGRTKEWPTNLLSNPVVSETSPPTPQNTVVEDLEAREQMIALKKIRDIDATLVVRRYNWDETKNTVYAPYDVSDPELFNHPTTGEIQAAASNVSDSYKPGSHYVITDEFHIFKCLSNGNGAKSTVKPTLPSNPPYTVSSVDGYVWKYMGTVANSQIQNFLTNQWIPVKTLRNGDLSNQWEVQSSAVNGSIDSYLLTNLGSGYVNVLAGTLDAGSASTAVLPLSDELSSVDGAYNGCHVWITGGAGFPSGPFTVTGYTAESRTISIAGTWEVQAGTTFEILPRAVISGNGTGATAKVSVDPVTKRVAKVTPIEAGSGYTTAIVEIVGGTTGTPAVATAQVAPMGGHGSDIERELNASFVMIVARLPFDDGSEDFPLSNDYRQIGLIRDVKFPTGDLANSLTLRASKAIKLSNVSSGAGGAFQSDEIIVGSNGVSTARARIVAIFDGPGANEATLHYYQDSSTGFVAFEAGMSIIGSTTSANGIIAPSGVMTPEIDILSGDILYIDNRRAVLRAPNQTEILRAVIKF
jgi:hypothetical protein